MIRVAIVDDHDLVRAGIRAILEQDPLFQVVGETGDGQDAIRLVTALRPDVVLMDVHLPGGLGGLDATEAIVKDCPGVKVIVLTQYENREYIRRALRIGARGYLLKSSAAPELLDAIKTVHAGQRYLHPSVADELVDLVTAGRSIEDSEDDYDRLTTREKQVFKLLAEGKTSRDISKYLTISLKTAMTHRTNIMEKLNMHTRSELIRYAVRKAVISVDGT
ncbi:MAG TPA: response regulator transcription factor [Vicinamibacterales bacterium]|jgi:DNA-binding NarL/FixJ family response regulator|nr:response regulator transcription factor [Acidobacteriota bacterium]HQX80830.1 response regulator transcription factor [Vicinamibacterales bacterium]